MGKTKKFNKCFLTISDLCSKILRWEKKYKTFSETVKLAKQYKGE